MYYDAEQERWVHGYRPDPEAVHKPTIADEAKTIVNEERVKEYGAPDKNFARVASAINALYGTDFKPWDVPVIMSLVKLSRVVESPQKRDSWIDLIGYALANELAADAEGRELD